MNAAAGAIALVLSLSPASIAYAHDIWLLPERFALSKGDTLTVHQLAGAELESELELPLLRRMTPRFELITPKRSIDLLGELPDEWTVTGNGSSAAQTVRFRLCPRGGCEAGCERFRKQPDAAGRSARK